MKKQFLILNWLFLVFLASAEDYQIAQITDRNRNFVLSTIRSGDKIIGRFFLMNPDPFYFYSMDNDDDLFPDIENNLQILATRKERGRPIAAIMVDFRNQEKVSLPILNFKYMLRYLAIMSFAKPYLKRVYIMNPKKHSRLFLAEVNIGEKNYFAALQTNEPITESAAKKFIAKLGFGDVSIIVAALDNIPIKFISLHGPTPLVLYESLPGHQGFSCVFLAGDKK